MSKLQAPCSYQGGKSRLASKIVDIMFEQNNINEWTEFYDLCCGSGAVSIELVNRGVQPSQITMVDKSPWGLFWQGVGDYSFSTEVFKYYINEIPKDITRIKKHVEEMSKQPANDGMFNNMVYKYLILQASSFGSKAIWVENNEWKNTSFRSYWLPTETSKRRSPVNPMMPMPDTLFDRVEAISANMMDVKGVYGDADKVEVSENSIVYIDPPYKDTTHYGHNFDYLSYIKKIKNKSSNVKIYLSEGIPLSNNAIQLSHTRKKGGISGNRKTSNEEWLNIF